MQEACKAQRALDQRWLELSTFALGICRSGGRDAECSANCVVPTCFISPYEKKRPTLSHSGERQKSVSAGLPKRDRNVLHGAPESPLTKGRWPSDDEPFHVRMWHLADMAPAAGDVRCRG